MNKKLLGLGVAALVLGGIGVSAGTALAYRGDPSVKGPNYTAERHEAMAGVSLLVNTTTLGMHGQLPLDVKLDALPLAAMVSDAIYLPMETDLLAQARLRGHRTVNGLGMLLNQARPAFASWFGVLPDITPELRAAIQATF